MKNNEKVLLALAAGLTAGALLGVLFAPNKGTKTRRLIKEEGKKVVDDLCEKFDKSMNGFNSLKKDIMTLVKEATCEKTPEPEEKYQ